MAATVFTTLDHTLGLLKSAYPELNPRAIAVAEQIAALLDVACRNDGRASPSETGCCLAWVHRELFCAIDTQDDGDDPAVAPIVIMIHKPHKGSPFTWDEDVEYSPTAAVAAQRLMELWRK